MQIVPLQVDVFGEADARHVVPVEEGVCCRCGCEEEDGCADYEECGEVGAQGRFGKDQAEGFESDVLHWKSGLVSFCGSVFLRGGSRFGKGRGGCTFSRPMRPGRSTSPSS